MNCGKLLFADERLRRRQRRPRFRTLNNYAPICTVIAIALLLLGLAYYLGYRNQLPLPLVRLGILPHALPTFGIPDAYLYSLPTFVHVAAFSLLTCALLRPAPLLALAVGVGWAAVNVAWELSCANHQAWLREAYVQARIQSAPLQCTFDKWDIGAALFGAAAAPLLTLFFVTLRTPRQNGGES